MGHALPATASTHNRDYFSLLQCLALFHYLATPDAPARSGGMANVLVEG